MKNSHFVIGIFIAIAFAKFAPNIGKTGGILKPEITVKYFAVAVIFLISGFNLPTEELTSAILRWDMHIFIQGFTFLLFPCLVQSLVAALRWTALHPQLLEGLSVLGTMPPPVSSAVIMTRAAGGNQAAAVFNSALGSLLGIVVTPALILTVLNSSEVHIPTHKIFAQLLIKVVMPLLLGQLLRRFKRRSTSTLPISLPTIANLMILLIVYSTFCEMFLRQDLTLDFSSIFATIFVVTILHLSIMYALLRLSSCSIFPYSSIDAVTISYCCSHKSLTLGVPVVELLFEGDPFLVFRVLPILVYGPTQIILGALSVPGVQRWLRERQQHRRKLTKHV